MSWGIPLPPKWNLWTISLLKAGSPAPETSSVQPPNPISGPPVLQGTLKDSTASHRIGSAAEPTATTPGKPSLQVPGS